MRTPRRAGEVRVSAPALAGAAGPAEPDPAGVARLMARRTAAVSASETPPVAAESPDDPVTRLLQRRAAADSEPPKEP